MTAVLLDERARSVIERQAVKRRLRETGGSLFGWESDGTLTVACASGPGPGAKHHLRSFEPAAGTTRAAMQAVEAASERRYGYLGSWHTHPLGTPAPSSIDIDTARAMAEQQDLLLSAPLLLILATTGTSLRVEPAVLRGWRWNLAQKRLQPVAVEDLSSRSGTARPPRCCSPRSPCPTQTPLPVCDGPGDGSSPITPGPAVRANGRLLGHFWPCIIYGEFYLNSTIMMQNMQQRGRIDIQLY